MTLDEYMAATELTDQRSGNTDNERLLYYACAIGGEAGEIGGKVKKYVRENGGISKDHLREQVTKEMGDVFWYMIRMCVFMGIDFEEVMQKNIEKTHGRKERGTLFGDGDDR